MNTVVLLFTAASCTLASGLPAEWAFPSKTGEERKVSNGSRIIGGQETDPHEFPWQISLHVDGVHDCGGSILNREWIVTAAHCIIMPDRSSLEVLAGSHDHSTKEKRRQWRSVRKVIPHPKFDMATADYDIALLKLSKPLSFKRRSIVGPISLPESEQDFTGQRCTASGWGATSSGRHSNVLRSVDLPVWSRKKCAKAYADDGPITWRMICAGYKEGGKGICFGDSGGPFVCKDEDGMLTLAGIASWGMDCAGPDYPSVFTAVSALVKWIEATMWKYA